MKKAVLIQPPVEDFYITQARTYPLNLLYLASVLLDEGVQASIIDMVNRDRQILTIPAHMAYLKKYYLPWDKSLYALFKHYQRFGFSGEKAEAIIRNTNADLFLIPSNFTAYFDRTVEIAGYVKKHHPDAVVITGGYHASAVPEKVASTGLFDHVITGEGEWGLKNIIHGSTD